MKQYLKIISSMILSFLLTVFINALVDLNTYIFGVTCAMIFYFIYNIILDNLIKTEKKEFIITTKYIYGSIGALIISSTLFLIINSQIIPIKSDMLFMLLEWLFILISMISLLLLFLSFLSKKQKK